MMKFRMYFGKQIELPSVNQILHMYGFEIFCVFFGVMYISWKGEE
jgi:hypothetical protein